MTAWESIASELFSGVMGMGDISVWMMFLIGGLLIYLGVKKDYEPMLLFPMGVGCILANIPGHFAVIPTGAGSRGSCPYFMRRALPMSFSRCLFLLRWGLCANLILSSALPM